MVCVDFGRHCSSRAIANHPDGLDAARNQGSKFCVRSLVSMALGSSAGGIAVQIKRLRVGIMAGTIYSAWRAEDDSGPVSRWVQFEWLYALLCWGLGFSTMSRDGL